MSSQIGSVYKLSLFGESHGHSIGCVIEGIPAGTNLDIDLIKKRLNQRRPGKDKYSTPRGERDTFEIISGYHNDMTTGTPLCVTIKNIDKRSGDYKKTDAFWRPGHADFTGSVKYNGANDLRGGGHFSARLTAPIVFAGAIAEQLLAEKGIEILSQIQTVNCITAESFESLEITDNIRQMLDAEDYAIQTPIKEAMLKTVDEARRDKDSVGGIVEGLILNVPVGLGEPFFDSFESKLAHAMFSIPGMKGLSFGKGFDFTSMRGSQANDMIYKSGITVKTMTNNNAGINGGISNGMPIWFKCAFKPTASISKTQKTYNYETHSVEALSIEGRHDPCIALRAVPIVKAMSAIVTYDLYRERQI